MICTPNGGYDTDPSEGCQVLTTHRVQAADNVTALQVYVLSWVAVAAASAASALAVEGVGNWQAVAVLAIIGGVAEGRSMPVTRRLVLSVAFIPVVLAAFLVGRGRGRWWRGPAWPAIVEGRPGG